MEAVLYGYRAVIPWRDLPEHVGDFRVVHPCHTRWAARGNPLRLYLTAGQKCELDGADVLLPGLKAGS